MLQAITKFFGLTGKPRYNRYGPRFFTKISN